VGVKRSSPRIRRGRSGSRKGERAGVWGKQGERGDELMSSSFWDCLRGKVGLARGGGGMGRHLKYGAGWWGVDGWG